MTDDMDVLASFSEELASLTPAPHAVTTRSTQSTVRARSKLNLIDHGEIRWKQARISDLISLAQ